MAKEFTCIFPGVPGLEGANVANFQSVCLTGRTGGVKQPISLPPTECPARSLFETDD